MDSWHLSKYQHVSIVPANYCVSWLQWHVSLPSLSLEPAKEPTRGSNKPSTLSSSSHAGDHEVTVAPICQKSWSPDLGHLSPSVNTSYFPSLSWTPQGVWQPAQPLPNILVQFVNSNSLIGLNSTVMFNVLRGTEISVHAESAALTPWIIRHTAAWNWKLGRPCTFGSPHYHKVGVRTPGPPKDRSTAGLSSTVGIHESTILLPKLLHCVSEKNNSANFN